eukprot:2393299-Rhodomonas_salina.1
MGLCDPRYWATGGATCYTAKSNARQHNLSTKKIVPGNTNPVHLVPGMRFLVFDLVASFVPGAPSREALRLVVALFNRSET